MTSIHASDEQLQQFAFDKNAVDPGIRTHIESCDTCQANVAAYSQLVRAIEQQALPMPTFDTSELVLARLDKKRQWWIYTIAASVIIPIGIGLYLFRTSLTLLFNGLSILIVCLAAITAICILMVTIAGQISAYRNACNKINSSPSHQ